MNWKFRLGRKAQPVIIGSFEMDLIYIVGRVPWTIIGLPRTTGCHSPHPLKPKAHQNIISICGRKP